MSQVQAAKRRKRLIYMAATGLGLWALLGVTSLTSGSTSALHGQMGQPVLSGFSQARADAQRIRFTLADEQYTLSRTATGWVMEETGGYPIRSDRLAELAKGLETLSFGEKRTSDPYKHNQIGLGDPAEDGNGALVEIFDAEDVITQSLIIGRKSEALYARSPEQHQTFRLQGRLPPFYNLRSWLDLDIIQIEPSAIRSVRLTDQAGQSLYLRRTEGSDARSFRPAPPNQDDRLISRLAASTSALAITRLTPVDVKPAEDLTTRPVARHITETFDGLEIDLSAYREPNGLWVTLRAVEAGEGARRAEVINQKAEGWAFQVTDYDFQDFTPRISSIVERVVTTE